MGRVGLDSVKCDRLASGETVPECGTAQSNEGGRSEPKRVRKKKKLGVPKGQKSVAEFFLAKENNLGRN